MIYTTAVFRITAIINYKPPKKFKTLLSFQKGASFFVLSVNTLKHQYFVCTKKNCPFSESSTTGYVPISAFVIDNVDCVDYIPINFDKIDLSWLKLLSTVNPNEFYLAIKNCKQIHLVHTTSRDIYNFSLVVSRTFNNLSVPKNDPQLFIEFLIHAFKKIKQSVDYSLFLYEFRMFISDKNRLVDSAKEINTC